MMAVQLSEQTVTEIRDSEAWITKVSHDAGLGRFVQRWRDCARCWKSTSQVQNHFMANQENGLLLQLPSNIACAAWHQQNRHLGAYGLVNGDIGFFRIQEKREESSNSSHWSLSDSDSGMMVISEAIRSSASQNARCQRAVAFSSNTLQQDAVLFGDSTGGISVADIENQVITSHHRRSMAADGKNGINCLAWMSEINSHAFIAGLDTGVVQAWDIRASKSIDSSHVYEDYIAGMAVCGHELVCASADGSVSVFDMRKLDSVLMHQFVLNNGVPSKLPKKSIVASSRNLNHRQRLEVLRKRKREPKKQQLNPERLTVPYSTCYTPEDEVSCISLFSKDCSGRDQSVSLTKYKVLVGSVTGLVHVFERDKTAKSKDYAWDYLLAYKGHPTCINTMLIVDSDTILTGSDDGLLRVIQIRPAYKLLGTINYDVSRTACSKTHRALGVEANSNAREDKSENSQSIANTEDTEDLFMKGSNRKKVDMSTPVELLGMSADSRFLCVVTHEHVLPIVDISFLYDEDDSNDDDDDDDDGGGGGGDDDSSDTHNSLEEGVGADDDSVTRKGAESNSTADGKDEDAANSWEDSNEDASSSDSDDSEPEFKTQNIKPSRFQPITSRKARNAGANDFYSGLV